MYKALDAWNWIDYAILAVIGFSTVMSFFRGFVREVISLSAWLLGLILSLKYAPSLQHYLSPWIGVESVRYFVSFILLFLGTVLLGLLINALLSVLMSQSGLSFTDRVIGLFFGASRGAIIVAVILLMIAHLGTVRDSLALKDSRLAPQFKPLVLWLNAFLPTQMRSVTEWVQGDSESGPASF
jgi:membrane protein required for colicin V production